MGSQSSKLVNESQQKNEHTVQLKGQSQQSSQMTVESSFSRKEQNALVNTLFKWNFCGSSVYVTGTFSNWKNHIQLQKQGHEFSIYVKLTPGVHQYKFIVDGEWRFSPDDLQSTDENGNINNIIDTSISKPTELEYMKESHQRPIPPIYQNKKERNDTNQTFDSDFGKLSINGSQQYSHDTSNEKPQKTALELQNERYGFFDSPQTSAPVFKFKDKAPMCPPHLKHNYFLRQKEHKLLNRWKLHTEQEEDMTHEEIHKQSIIDRNRTLLRFFDSDHSLAPPQHVTINHVCIKTQKNKPYKVYSITHRFKQKYTTFKFFTSQYVEKSDKIFVP